MELCEKDFRCFYVLVYQLLAETKQLQPVDSSVPDVTVRPKYPSIPIMRITSNVSPSRPLKENHLHLHSTKQRSREQQRTNRHTQRADHGLRLDPRRGTIRACRRRRAPRSRARAIAVLAAAVATRVARARRPSGVHDARGRSLGQGGVRAGRLVGLVAAAEDGGIGGALAEEALDQVADGLVDGQAVEAAVVVIGDDVGVTAALDHDVGRVFAVGEGADGICFVSCLLS